LYETITEEVGENLVERIIGDRPVYFTGDNEAAKLRACRKTVVLKQAHIRVVLGALKDYAQTRAKLNAVQRRY
jgi:hypothetical protein